MRVCYLMLVLCLSLVGCTPQQENKSFYDFLDECFVEMLQNDYPSTHVLYKNPERVGIKNQKVEFVNIKEETPYKSMSKRLHSYKNKVTKSEKVYYTALDTYLNKAMEVEDERYDYIYNICDPLYGVAVSGYETVAEFKFYKEQDIKDYITLMNSYDSQVKDINEYLRIQSKKGYFMPHATSRSFISQLDQYMDDGLEAIRTHFNDYDFDFDLSVSKKKDYLHLIETAFNEHMITGMRSIKATVNKYKDTCKNELGLGKTKLGKEYFSKLLHFRVGTHYDPDDFVDFMKKSISKISLYNDFSTAYVDTGFDDYDSILKDLQSHMKKDFPSLKSIKYNLSAIDQANAVSGVKAYYLTPAIDEEDVNTIKVNRMSEEDVNSIDTYVTLAHEGYPGHMYVANYFKSLHLPKIMNLIEYLGYSEGVATYVENYSYKWIKGNRHSIDYEQNKQKLIYAFVLLEDIYINYYGYSFSRLESVMKTYGVSVSYEQYTQLLNTPCLFETYWGGYYLLNEMYENASKTKGKDFSDLEFHKLILAHGPLSYDQLEDICKKHFDY